MSPLISDNSRSANLSRHLRILSLSSCVTCPVSTDHSAENAQHGADHVGMRDASLQVVWEFLMLLLTTWWCCCCVSHQFCLVPWGSEWPETWMQWDTSERVMRTANAFPVKVGCISAVSSPCFAKCGFQHIPYIISEMRDTILNTKSETRNTAKHETRTETIETCSETRPAAVLFVLQTSNL